MTESEEYHVSLENVPVEGPKRQQSCPLLSNTAFGAPAALRGLREVVLI